MWKVVISLYDLTCERGSKVQLCERGLGCN